MYDQNEQNPVIKTVKSMIASPLFLVGAIGYSVYAVFKFFDGILGGSSLSSLMNSLSRMGGGYGIDYSYIQAYMGAYNGVRIMIAFIAVIPVFLIVAGMWLSFAAVKSENGNLHVTGLTMIRVIVIIQLVFVCLGLVLLELLCIVATIGMNAAMSYYRSGSSVGALMIIFMIGIAAGGAVQILYYLKLEKMINRMKEVILSGRPNDQISLYVEILCYITGGVAAISALMSLAGLSVYGFLANAGLATADISFAIFLRKYRGKMEELLRAPDMMNQAQDMRNHVQDVRNQVQDVRSQVQDVRSQAQSVSENNETTVLPYYNETSVLSGQFMNGGRIQLVRMTRQKTGETICISKPSFWIGKDAANVDYCITDNSAISRRHALVTIQNSSCYVRDNRSTNRVFVNGQALQPDVDTLLSDGDRMRLGDEEFVISIG